MIKMQVIGNLGRDAVVNTVNGKTVINFTVAHTEKFKTAQGVQQDKTIWVDCAYWTDKTAIAPYLKKGTQVYADGQPDLRTYTNKEGVQVTILTLRTLMVQLVGNRADNTEGGTNQQNSYQSQQPSANDGNAASQTAAMEGASVQEPLDDLPF